MEMAVSITARPEPLHLEAYLGPDIVVKNLLEEESADVAVLNSIEETPLHQSATAGHLSTCILLMDHPNTSAFCIRFNASILQCYG